MILGNIFFHVFMSVLKWLKLMSIEHTSVRVIRYRCFLPILIQSNITTQYNIVTDNIGNI